MYFKYLTGFNLSRFQHNWPNNSLSITIIFVKNKILSLNSRENLFVREKLLICWKVSCCFQRRVLSSWKEGSEVHKISSSSRNKLLKYPSVHEEIPEFSEKKKKKKPCNLMRKFLRSFEWEQKNPWILGKCLELLEKKMFLRFRDISLLLDPDLIKMSLSSWKLLRTRESSWVLRRHLKVSEILKKSRKFQIGCLSSRKRCWFQGEMFLKRF